MGRTALDRRPLEEPDLGSVELDPHLDILFRDGWRSVLAAPMLRGERMVGALVIRRRTGCVLGRGGRVAGDPRQPVGAGHPQRRVFGELETKTRELEVACRHKSEFLASMSHELRTPLNAVIGFSEVLIDRMFGELNERQEEYLKDIRNSGQHLLELLNEILDLSKVEAGQMELEGPTFSVPAAIEYGLSLVRERARPTASTFTLDVADDVGVIEADGLRFKQVVLNLVSNAVKFTPDGGSVSVRPRMDGTESTYRSLTPGRRPAEDRERIFESFQQGARGAAEGRGHRSGAHLVPADRRAVRRAAVAETPRWAPEAPSGSPFRSGRWPERTKDGPPDGSGWCGRR